MSYIYQNLPRNLCMYNICMLLLSRFIYHVLFIIGIYFNLRFILVRTYVLQYLTKKLWDYGTPNLLKTLWRRKFYIKWSMTSKVIQGHIRSLFCQNHSSTFVYGPIFMKICMNANTWRHNIWPEMKFCEFFKLELQPWLTFLWTTFVLV